MSPKKLGFIFLISLSFTEVVPWTIDLPEARKYLFEKVEKDVHHDEIKKDYNEQKLFFDNIEPDSPHNKDELERLELEHGHGRKPHVDENDVYGDKYAHDYEYLSYTQKKVHNIVHNGSVYLEGLRRALEDYGELLKNCSRQNFTQSRSPNGPWLPENEQPYPQVQGQPSNAGNFGPGNSGNFGPGNSGNAGNFGPGSTGNFGPGNTSNSGNFGPGNSGNFGPGNSGNAGNFGPGSTGNFGPGNTGNSGNFGPGNSGNFGPGNSGNAGNFGPGSTGNFGPGNTGNSGNFGPGNSGNFGPGNSGNAGNFGPGNTGNSGNFGPGNSGNFGPGNSGNAGNFGPGSTGNFGPGNTGNSGNFGPGNTGNFGPGNSGSFGPGNFSQMSNQTFFNVFNPLNQSQLTAESCERATRASEHVRRLAELALWATRELQDRAYASKFEKQSHDEEQEEAELLLRLAFFLDRLAFYTGYEPQPQQYVSTSTTPRPALVSLPPVSMMGDVSEDSKRRMMDCIRSESSDPDKCRYPQPQPDFIRTLFNITDSPESVQPVSTTPYVPIDGSLREIFKNPSLTPVTRQKRDLSANKQEPLTKDQEESPTILATAFLTKKLAHKVAELHEDRSFDKFPEYPHHRAGLIERFAALRHTRRKIIEKLAEFSRHHEEEEELGPGFVKRDTPTTRHKREAGNRDPALELMKYYVKHQVWMNSNPSEGVTSGVFEVGNEMAAAEEYHQPPIRRVKRSITKKFEHLRLPEDPYQDISDIVKHKPGVNYVKDDDMIEKTRRYLDKIRHSSTVTAKNYAQKILKKKAKRSVKYERKFLPSRSQNPRQDISYYVKNKEGTDYNPSVVQAAQVRSGLESAFQYPNIEVVRRFGSNYNPAVPFPLGYGIAQSFYVDI